MNAEVRLRTPVSRGRPTPMKLIVLAVDAADIVTAAGGVIIDLVRAGWTVEAYMQALSDERALRILGVRAQALPTRFDEKDVPDVIYCSAELLSNRGVRMITESARRNGGDVAFWGDDPSGIEAGATTQHRLSPAAKAFKAHAMTAAGVTAHVHPTEAFRSGKRRVDKTR
jgi:hypothetical protein